MKELLISRDASVFHCDWRDLVIKLAEWHSLHPIASLIVDAPYSDRTHSGHDDGALTATRASSFAASEASGDAASKALRRYAARHGDRKQLNYASWGADEVSEFVAAWSPLVRGWFVSITDTTLAPAWANALEAAGRLVFSPIACVEPGSRVRMMGDGPSQWSCWAVVARPKGEPYSKWGALPGAYVVPPGHNARATNGGKQVVGGKPDWLMDALVRDYSRPGDIVCDPCCGAGTTGTAALRAGRRFIGCDALEAHAKLAAKALSMPIQRPLVLPMPGETVQQPITFQDS